MKKKIIYIALLALIIPVVGYMNLGELTNTQDNGYVKNKASANALPVGYAKVDYGVTNVPLKDVTGQIYPAGTNVARAGKTDAGATGDYFMGFSINYTGNFAFGAVKEQYVTKIKTETIKYTPNEWIVSVNMTQEGMDGDLTPASATPNKSELQINLTTAEKKATQTGDYTAETLNILSKVYNDSLSVYNNSNATQSQIDVANQNLLNAMNSLIPINKTTITMHRIYNPNSGEHFYTSSEPERDSLVKRGWKYEGISWEAPMSGNPVYRLYNPNSGDHHYTTSSAEQLNLFQNGWRLEGTSWWTGGGIPLYRLYNPNAVSGTHHYTKSEAEVSNLVKSGWRREGVGWYGMQ